MPIRSINHLLQRPNKKLTADLEKKAKNIFERYVPDLTKDLFKTAENKGTDSEYRTTVLTFILIKIKALFI